MLENAIGTPIITSLDFSSEIKCEPISKESNLYKEDFIQELCYKNPSIIPFEKIEPIFDSPVPLCREMNISPEGKKASNYCDVVYINDNGYITITECKLWRNSEARREVVGQIFDYAKDLASLSYEEFENKVLQTRKNDKSGNHNENSLYEIVKSTSDVSEEDFIDSVNKNLREGKFLLLIIGDGIRENVEEMINFFNKYTKMSFTVSILALDIYKALELDKFLVVPNCLAKTKIITLNRLEESNVSPQNSFASVSIPLSISDSVFFDKMAELFGKENSETLKEFIERLSEKHNIFGKLGRGKSLTYTLTAKSIGKSLFTVDENGTLIFYGHTYKKHSSIEIEAGKKYIEKIAILFKNKFNPPKSNDDYGKIFESKSKKNQFLGIADMLQEKDEFENIIAEYIENMSVAQNS